MKNYIAIIAMMSLLGNIQAETERQKTREKVASALLIGAAVGIVGYRYFILPGNNSSDPMVVGKRIAETIEKSGGFEKYIEKCLADEYIRTVEYTVPDTDERMREFGIKSKSRDGREYTEEELKPARSYLTMLEKNLEAYNVYAAKTGQVPCIMKKAYEHIKGEKLLRCIGIKKYIEKK